MPRVVCGVVQKDLFPSCEISCEISYYSPPCVFGFGTHKHSRLMEFTLNIVVTPTVFLPGDRTEP